MEFQGMSYTIARKKSSRKIKPCLYWPFVLLLSHYFSKYRSDQIPNLTLFPSHFSLRSLICVFSGVFEFDCIQLSSWTDEVWTQFEWYPSNESTLLLTAEKHKIRRKSKKIKVSKVVDFLVVTCALGNQSQVCFMLLLHAIIFTTLLWFHCLSLWWWCQVQMTFDIIITIIVVSSSTSLVYLWQWLVPDLASRLGSVWMTGW